MNTLLVGYDLNSPGQEYKDLIAKLKTYDNWWHHLDSTWLIKTSKSHTAVRNELKAYLIDANDELLVIDVTGDAAAWYGFSDKGSTWLRTNL